MPTKSLINTLTALTSDENNIIYIVSGRDQSTLDGWLGHIPNLGLSAEHGCFVKSPNESAWNNLVEDVDTSWKNEILQVFQHFTERTPGSFIEEKHVSIVWHYRLADQDFGSWQAKECKSLLEKSILSKFPIELLSGKKNLEIRPSVMNKGEISKRIYSWYYPLVDFIFCAGDDRTDEDMFRCINHLVSMSPSASSIQSSPLEAVGSPGSELAGNFL